MTRAELITFYSRKAEEYSALLTRIRKTINLISNARLLIVLISLVLIYVGLKEPVWLYALPLLLIVFVILVQKHSRYFGEKVHLENLLIIQQNEIRSLNGDHSAFPAGNEFINTHHSYTHDLDIFGEASLFQFVNRNTSIGGKERLASELSEPLRQIDIIQSKQEAIGELSGMTGFRHTIQALEMQVDEQAADRKQLQEWTLRPSFLFGKPFYKFILLAIPAITIFVLVLSFFVDNAFPYFLICGFIQWIFLGFHVKKVNEFHYYIGRKKNILDKYGKILSCIHSQEFSATLLKKLSDNASFADQKLRSLASLVGAFDARLNWMTNIFVNSILLYDLQCVYRLEQWKEANADSLNVWLDTVHEMEALCSFGTFAFNQADFVYPSINNQRKLSGDSVGHPLLSKEERVVNDIHLDVNQSILIITGANMAGKSTFLRTIGVNVVLGLAGAPVCAGQFDCPILDIRSGMRTADSLHDHQSYFYAELNRLRSIVDELKEGKHLLILLDEILKGTNSTDKQAGSIALVKQLIHYPSLVFIATHDLALGDLEKEYPKQVRNFCFEPFIENDQLSFDYKLKPGIATKMNATFLMKKMGIIPS